MWGPTSFTAFVGFEKAFFALSRVIFARQELWRRLVFWDRVLYAFDSESHLPNSEMLLSFAQLAEAIPRLKLPCLWVGWQV